MTLTAWFAERLAGVDEVRVEGLGRLGAGHSAELLTLTLVSRQRGVERRDDLVVRLRPPEPGLLEPYDLQRQFDVLRALEASEVRVPRALWIESSPDVLGRPFLVMERVDGAVYERQVPEDFAPERIRRMTESFVDQLAAIHRVDLDATGLRRLGDGRDQVAHELDRWEGEMQRVKRGPLPALERLIAELRAGRPKRCPRVTLLHGDAKPGNFAFVGDEVSAVFDWELADVGDPLTDVAYAERMWAIPVGLPSRPGALTADELVARYQERTGIEVTHREWYRAMQAYKLAVIMLLGSMLFDAGHSDDLRLAEMAFGVGFVTAAGLRDLGVDGELDAGPVAPRDERIREVRSRAG